MIYTIKFYSTYVYFNTAKISKQIVFFSLLLSRNMFRSRYYADGSMLILPLSSCPLNLRAILSKATCFPRAKSMKSRAIPMHNFLLRYFPAYRARMFPPVGFLVICAHVLASAYAYVYVQACPGAIERVGTPRNERTNERGKIVDSMGLMTLGKATAVSSFMIGIVFTRLNNLEIQFVLGLILDNLQFATELRLWFY